MPLTKTQKNVLKKIDANFNRFEKMSVKAGYSLDQYVVYPDFYFPDVSSQEKRDVHEQSKKRKQLFEQTKRKSKAL